MKKLIIMIFMLMITGFTFGKTYFFINTHSGVLVKIDPASAFKTKYPDNPGPRVYEIPVDVSADVFENDYIKRVPDEDKDFFLSMYKKDNDGKTYSLQLDPDVLVVLKRLRSIFRENKLDNYYQTKIPQWKYNKFTQKIDNQEDLAFFESHYTLNGKKYYLQTKWDDAEHLRAIFMYLNRDNEMHTGLEESGTPTPHHFPRVFEAKTKANIDIVFSWGAKIETPKTNGSVMIGFGLMFTNFVMPSLEITVKRNFIINGYPVEPYVGGCLYGGWLDGFPVGLSVIGGADLFPAYPATNHYIMAEMRLGTVLFAPIYFDSGENHEGIWKEFTLLLETGFYLGYGYRFNRKN